MPVVNFTEGTNVSISFNKGPLNGGNPGGGGNTVQYNNNGVLGGVAGVTSDGQKLITSNSNISITGGTSNQILKTDGNGNLSWTSSTSMPGGTNTQVQYNNNGSFNGISGVTTDGTKLIVSDPTNLVFLNSNVGLTGATLVNFGDGTLTWGMSTIEIIATATAAAASEIPPVSGSAGYIQLSDGANGFTSSSNFTYTNDTLTLNSKLSVNGSTGLAGQVLTSNGATNDLIWTTPNVGTVTSVSGSGSGLGFSLSGSVTSTGSLTLTAPDATTLRTNLGIGNVANLNLNGNTSQYLNGSGTFTNVVSGSDTQVQFNDAGVLAGDTDFTYNKTTNTLTVGNIASVDSVTFDTVNVTAGQVGRFTWNDGDGTLDLGLKGGNVTLQLGQEQVVRAYNNSGVTLVDGKIVKVTGAQGNRVSVQLAQADSDPNSAETLGMCTESATQGSELFVTTSGLVRGLNTTVDSEGNTLVEGDMLFLSPTIPGGYTKVRPTAPNHTVILGYVVRVHASTGSIFIKVDNGYELDELHNVVISNVANTDILQYDGTVWRNSNVTTIRSSLNIGNIANLNLNGSTSNVLVGDGTWQQYYTGTVTSVGGTGSGLGFSLSGSVTSSGSLTLATPDATTLRTNLSIGNVANINLNGNSSTVLSGDGTWVQQSTGGGGETISPFLLMGA